MDNRNNDNEMPVVNDQQANIDVQIPVNNRQRNRRPLFIPMNNINLQAEIQYANLQWQAHRHRYNRRPQRHRPYDPVNNQQRHRPYGRRPQGLTAARIQRFQQFQADQSLVGEECAVCLADIDAVEE